MEKYLNFKITGDFEKDIKAYFLMHHRLDTYEHTLDVVRELYNIEKQFGIIEEGSDMACYCHDLGRVVDKYEIIEFCIQNNIEITDEEIKMPSILHQKISRFIAENVFGIKNKNILNAIRYHTTLRREPSNMEMVVLLADKLSWKEEGYEEFVKGIREAIEHSKEKVIFFYLTNLELNKENLLLYHRDSKEAYEFFRQKHNT